MFMGLFSHMFGVSSVLFAIQRVEDMTHLNKDSDSDLYSGLVVVMAHS